MKLVSGLSCVRLMTESRIYAKPFDPIPRNMMASKFILACLELYFRTSLFHLEGLLVTGREEKRNMGKIKKYLSSQRNSECGKLTKYDFSYLAVSSRYLCVQGQAVMHIPQILSVIPSRSRCHFRATSRHLNGSYNKSRDMPGSHSKPVTASPGQISTQA